MEEQDQMMSGSPLAGLAGLLGMTGDAADEHWRWGVYEAACELPEARELLLEATRAEPDALVAVGVALEMLEREAPTAASSWVGAVPLADQERVAARAEDVASLRAVQHQHAAVSDDEVAQWSDWLQRRVTQLTASESVLRVLEHHGRSRRVRGEAHERLMELARG